MAQSSSIILTDNEKKGTTRTRDDAVFLQDYNSDGNQLLLSIESSLAYQDGVYSIHME